MDSTKLSGDQYMSLSVDAMQTATNDERGTVRALAREVEEAHADRALLDNFIARILTFHSRWDQLSILRSDRAPIYQPPVIRGDIRLPSAHAPERPLSLASLAGTWS